MNKFNELVESVLSEEQDTKTFKYDTPKEQAMAIAENPKLAKDMRKYRYLAPKAVAKAAVENAEVLKYVNKEDMDYVKKTMKRFEKDNFEGGVVNTIKI